jgi:simple sugar transport system permease protein
MPDWIVAVLVTAVPSATPLLLAALGELVTERSGVLNLGVEGMMVVGAMAGFAVAVTTGSPTLGFLAGALAGAAMAGIFAVLTLAMLANQVATGLALTIFGIGLSALVGQGWVGLTLPTPEKIVLPYLTDLPVVGRLLFGQDLVVYGAVALLVLVAWFLRSTRAGLILRAVGENPDSAHAIGHPVLLIRTLAVLFGGALAGVAGAYLSVIYTPMWAENMTAGRGWIALALVVFAAWRPWPVLLGAYLFGVLTILQFHAQAMGVAIPSQFLAMLPYVATVVVLVLISRDGSAIRRHAPASLGRIFHPAR